MAQNYYRLATLLIDFGSKILTEYLEHHCAYKDLQDLLNGQKHNLHHSSYPEHRGNCCCNLKIKVKRYKITKAQFDALFDNIGALPPCGRSGTHYCYFKPKTPITLDITLARLLIVNTIPTLSTTDSAAVDEIRKLRNFVAHSPETSISDQEFELKWCASRDNILHLARTLPQPFATEMKNDIDGLKTKSIDSSECMRLLEVVRNIRETDSILEEMKSEVQGVKEVVHGIKGEVHEMTGVVHDVKSEVEGAKGAILENKSEVREVKSEVHEMKGKVQDIKDEVHGVKGAILENKGEVREVKSEVHEMKGKVQDMKDEVHGVKGAILENKDEVREVKSEVHEMKGKVQDIKDEVHGVKGAILENKGEVQEVKSEVHEMKGKVQDMKDEVHGVKGAILENKGEVREVKSEVHEMKGKVQDIKDEVHGIKGAILENKGEVREVISEVREMKGNVQDVKDEVHGVKGAILENEGEVREVKSEVREMKGKVQDIKDEVHGVKGAILVNKGEVQEVKSEIHQVKDEVKCLRKDVQRMESDVLYHRANPDEKYMTGIHREPRLKQLIENTAMMLQKHRKKMYVSHKRAMEAAYTGLCKDRHITITGRGGEGKTSLGNELMDKMCNEQTDDEQRYTPVILDKADDFDLINGKDHLVILIDDPFGKSNTDKQRLEEWERRFEKMSSFIKEGKIFIILCIRSYILKGIDEKLRGVEFLREEKSVNLSGKFQLDSNEKYDMLKAYEQAQSSDSTGANEIDDSILRNVSESYPSLGFPHSCHLFFSSKHISDNILDFFNQPDRSLQKEIYNMKKSDPTQYMVLVFMLLEGGKLNLDKLDTDKLEKLCELAKMHSVDVGDITECVLYGNVYIELREGCYQFTHQTILESVLLSFCRTYPEVFLQLGTYDMILDFARPAGYKGVPGEVCVILPESCHRQLAKLIASLQKGHYVLVMRGYYTDKSFVKNFVDVIESEKLNFFEKNPSFVSVLLSKTNTLKHYKYFLHFLTALCKRLANYRIPSSEESLTVKKSLRKTKLPVYLFIYFLNLILEAGEVAVVEEILDSSGLHLHLRFNLNGEIIDDESVPLTVYRDDTWHRFASMETQFSDYCCGNPVCYACLQRTKNLSLRLIDRMETVNLDNVTQRLMFILIARDWPDGLERLINKNRGMLRHIDLSNLMAHAVKRGSKNSVLYLLDFDMTLFYERNKTLLQYCLRNDSVDVFCKINRENNSILNTLGMSQSELIFDAARYRSKQIFLHLLQYNIDITACNQYGKNLLNYCCENDWVDVFDKVLEKDEKLLTKPGLSPSRLILHAAKNHGEKMVARLLRYNIDFTVTDEVGYTLLHHCCQRGWDGIFNKILKQDEQVLYKTGLSPSMLILHAARSVHLESLAKPLIYPVKSPVSLSASDKNDGKKMVSHLLRYDIDFTMRDMDGKTLLHYCCEEDWMEIFDKVVEKDEEVLTKPGISPSLLILHATCYSCENMVSHMLQYDIDFTVSDKDGKTLLHYCCEKDWIDIFDKVLEKDEKVLTKPGLSPSLLLLHAAACPVNLESFHPISEIHKGKQMVLHLLQYDIDFTMRDKDGKTLLHYCCEKDWIDIFDKVLEKDETVLTKPGLSPSLLLLHAAACPVNLESFQPIPKIHKGKQMVLHMLQYDNDFTMRDKDGKTLLFCPCGNDWIDKFDKVLETDEKVLTKPGLSPSLLIPNAASSANSELSLSPFTDGCKKRKVSHLLQYDIDFTVSDKDGKTLLHYCCEKDWVDIFDKVLEKDEKVLTKPGLSPSLLLLHTACNYCEEMGSRLLQYDIDFTVSDKDGKTLLHYCCERNWIDLFDKVLERNEKVLTKPGLSPSLLMLHAACNNCDIMVSHLLQYDIDFTVSDKYGKTLLHYCCEKDRIDIFNKVLEKDEKVLTKPGLSPSLLILYAASSANRKSLFPFFGCCRIQMVSHLFQYDIDFTVSDKDGKTLLHYCCEKYWINIFDKVLEKDEKVLTKPGLSPSLLILHAACNNCGIMVSRLLQYDIDFTVSDKDGKTLLHYCCEKNWIDLFDKVLEKDEKVLTKPGLSPSLLILHAACNNCGKMVSRLLQYDIDFTVSDKDGETLLHYCCENFWIDIFDKVLERDEKLLTKPGLSPSLLILHAASSANKKSLLSPFADCDGEQMVSHLLQYDIDFTVSDEDGKTLLHYCCKNNWNDIVIRVLERMEK